MPSVSKSKARNNNRTSMGAVKEQLKDVVKTAVSKSSAAENLTVGTVHQLESEIHSNVFSRNGEECDAHSGSSGTGLEIDDLVSNNGSFSGESEDTKEKTASHIIDVEKREKIRLRNEKKHQRQRERRAQELHERCCSLLMAKKLDSLSRQLAAMGFTSERASVALKMNNGKLEESVVWLLEGNTEASRKSTNQASECALNIDIADELAQIEAMETRYSWPKKDVERAVVSSEGDLQKAEEMVRRLKQESLLSSNKSEENTTNNNTVPQLEKSLALDSLQQLKGERDQNYPNIGTISSESLSKYSHVNGVSDGSWHPFVSNLPRNTLAQSASVLTRPSTSASVVDAGRSFTGSVANNIQLSDVREPLVVMQRPQYSSTRQVPQSTSYPISTTGYESLISCGNVQLNQSLISNGAGNVHQQQTNYQADYRHQDPSANLSETSRRQLGNLGSRNATSPSSPPLNVPSSLGLFSTRTNGQSGSSASHVDWNHVNWYAAGQMPLCDYTSIDWTMDSNPLSKSKSQWDSFGLSSIWTNHGTTGDTLSGLSRGMMAGRNVSVGGSHEWTSPFGGNDIFSAPRQFVNSSTLW